MHNGVAGNPTGESFSRSYLRGTIQSALDTWAYAFALSSGQVGDGSNLMERRGELSAASRGSRKPPAEDSLDPGGGSVPRSGR